MIIEEKTVVLRKAIVVGDATYAELNLRESTAGEMSKATRYGGENNVDVAISLISQIAGVPMIVVQGLSQRDFQECNDFLGSFALGLETGETSSPN